VVRVPPPLILPGCYVPGVIHHGRVARRSTHARRE
jgi:hypothetical protein